MYPRCATLKIRRRILFHFQYFNVETTLIRRSNIGWVHQCWFINKSSRSQMFCKMDVLENRCFSRESTSGGVSFFNEIVVLLFAVCKFIKKETLAKLSSYGFCEIFKKTFLKEHRCFYIKYIIDFESQ